jgi:hypothetical protein
MKLLSTYKVVIEVLKGCNFVAHENAFLKHFIHQLILLDPPVGGLVVFVLRAVLLIWLANKSEFTFINMNVLIGPD